MLYLISLATWNSVVMHKFEVIIITGFLAILIAGNFASSTIHDNSIENASTQNSQILVGSARSRLKLPKLFSFDYYQQLFGKVYPSTIEKMTRAKIYLGRAFRAFISVIGYKHRKSDSFLAINDMSDWTSIEVEKTMMNPSLLLAKDAKADSVGLRSASMHGEVQPVDLNSIEQELEEIVEHKDGQPFFGMIADELTTKSNHDIKRRDIRSNLRDLSLNDLVIGGGKQIKAAKTKIINRLEPLDTMNKQMGEMMGSVKENKYLKSVIHCFSSSSPKTEEDSSQLPDAVYIDHRKCLLPPRHQGRCGCCYAFAAVALYEWAYCRATGEQVAFSEQYVIDCGNKEVLMGCSAGHTHEVRKFVQTNGLELLDKYPYHAEEQECPYGAAVPAESRGSLRIMDEGWNYVNLKSLERKLKEAPLVINLYVERGLFQEYGGGVDLAESCRSENMGMHSLLLVGSGREDGNEYWLMRNSFGQRWGELGYYKLNKKSDCVIPYSGLVLKLPQRPVVEKVQKHKPSTQVQNDWKKLFE